MPIPLCTVNNNSTLSEISVEPGEEITIALQDPAGVSSWSLRCVSADEYFCPYIDGYTAALNIDALNKTATLTMPEEPCAFIFESKVNQGRNRNGDLDPSLVSRFMVHVPTSNGFLLCAVGETTEANAEWGWTKKLNDVFRAAGSSASVSAPIIDALNFTLADPAGGDEITITGEHLASAAFVKVGGIPGSILSATDEELVFSFPAIAAGTYDVVVTNLGGDSNALSIESWAPTTDPTCTLFYDSKHTPYNPLAGTWDPRFSVQDGISDDTLAMTSFSTSNQTANDGAPVFDGDGADQGGLKMPDSSWTANFVGPVVSGHRAGSTFAVADHNNNDLIPATDSSGGNVYDNPSLIYQPSMFSLATGRRDSDNQPIVRAWIYNSTDVYASAQVVSSQGVPHAMVARWGLGNGTPGSTSLDLSVDGALSGASYHQRNLSQGVDTSYSAHVFRIGVSYPYSAVTHQDYAGTIRCWGILNAKASDTFVTKFHQWSQCRFGVGS